MRPIFALLLGWLSGAFAYSAATSPTSPPAVRSYATVTPGKPLVFPSDFGSHPDFRTEWWYITGWLNTASGERLGFQITFFRTKPDTVGDNPSSFSPRQIQIAHCAISDTQRGRLWQDQRIRRAGLGLADAQQGDTAVWIDGWSLKRESGKYAAKIQADEFAFDLNLSPTQELLVNGDEGVSRKGSQVAAASYYYSVPHLKVSGSVAREGRSAEVTGEAWLDHEWSSEYLDEQSVGWDWVGLNLDDGAALMAFRIRGAQGEKRWAGATWRNAAGEVRVLRPDQIAFDPIRTWRSPRTGNVYPVEWRLQVAEQSFDIAPLMDDQENDTRLTTGAIYWEGAVQVSQQRHLSGHGYLELTGYGEKLSLPGTGNTVSH